MYATARGRWSYWAVLVLWALGFAACVGPALFGTQHWNVGALGGFIGAALGARMRNGEFWRLQPGQRRQVDQAVLTGVPTGFAALDAVARDRLERAVRSSSTGNTITAAVCAVVTLVVPVVASVRMTSWWYSTALVPTVILVAVAARTRRTSRHPAERLRRFDRAVGSAPTAV